MARIPIPLYTERQTVASGPFLGDNAQGGRLGNYAGQVSEEVGSALGSIADVAKRREEDQAVAWSTNAASRFKVDQFQRFQQAKDTAPTGGDGLTKNYLESYDTDAQQLIDTAPTPRAKHYLNVHLNTFRTQMGEQSIREEYVLGKQYLASSATDAVNSSAQLIGQPGGDRGRFQSELDTQLASIKSLSLPPDVKDKLADHAKKTLTDAYWTAYVRDDPQGAANLLRGRQPLSQPGVTSPQEAIRNEAKAQGVDPHTALAIASIENDTFDPSRPNAKGSSALGLFQVISSTWNELGGTDANRGDMATQAKLGVKNLAQNARALKDTLRREPTPGEVYSTQWGLGFAGALAKAPDSMPVRDVFQRASINPDTALAQNGLPPNMTAGQLRSAFNTQMGKAMSRTQAFANAPESGQEPAAPMDSNAKVALDNTPVPQQMAYLTHAESMARRDDSQQKAAMEGRINDTAAAYTNLRDAPNPPTLPELVETYGAVRGSQQFARLQDLQSYAHIGAGFATMSTAQIDAAVSTSQPAPGEGYAEKTQAWRRVAEVAQNIKQARFNDPLATDQSIGSHLTKPIDWSDDTALAGAMAARYSQAQMVADDYGTGYTPLTKTETANLAATIDQLPPAAALGKLATLRAAAGADTPRYGALMAQIAPSHPSVAIAGMLADANPQAAAFILQGDRILNPGKLDKAAEGKTPNLLMPDASKFEAAWGEQRGAAFQGLDPDSRAHLNAAIAYYVGALPAGKRDAKNIDPTVWKQAVDAVAPVSQDLTGNTVLIPPGYNSASFQDDIAAQWPQALAAYGLDPKDYPAQAYSLLSAGQDGVYTAYDGGGVPLNAGGRRVLLNLTDRPIQAYGVNLPPALTKQRRGGPGVMR